MNKVLRTLSSALLCVLSAGALQAQYTVNVPTETGFAKAEYAALGIRPTSIAVPHLKPASVTAALANSQYLPSGNTPFTFVIAHRGSHTAPGCAENSACAIAAAYESGADAIELDIKITADNGPVLGHDVAIARELNNWINPSGQSVTRSSAWTPFSGFPILDYKYLDLSKYPFLNNFKIPASGGGVVVDPNNPTRSTMDVSDLQNGVVVDTYNLPTGNHQLTLYEALFLIQNYYPMAVWLDVKSASDLVPVGKVITVARQQMPSLGNISLKVGWSTVADSSVNGNPGSAMGLSNISYFLVFGTGDLDTMAVYNGQSAPTSASQASTQAYNSFRQLCTSANGCFGAELSHKYTNAPTQSVFSSIQGSSSYQLAAFHTVPQYSWYWQTLATQKQQAATYGRTFPRTDGSCCFALTDSLNVSQYVGSESQDLRALFSWNEKNFTTITTDEPLTVLRDLAVLGKRPTNTAGQIGGTNTSIPSGGSSFDQGIFADGLYYVQMGSTNSRLAVSGSGTSLVLVSSGSPAPNQMWYLSGKPAQTYTLTNAGTGQSISLSGTGIGTLGLGQANDSPNYLWSISNPYSNPYIIRSSNIQVSSQYLGYNGNMVMNYENANLPWTLTPVNTPSSEKAQQQLGPAGFTYCADGDVSPAQTCSFNGQGSIAYGANGNFRYLPYTSGPITCNLSNFNNIDPAPGVVKACFYAPYGSAWTLPATFTADTTDGHTFNNSSPWQYAYGVVAPNGAALYTYKTVPAGTNIPCGVATFGYDPAPGILKTCSYGPSASSLPGPSGFSYCAGEGMNCVFAGTAAVAYGTATNYTYKTFTNGMHCGVDSFGLDPVPNVLKSCFYMPATSLGQTTSNTLPSSFTMCANGESGICSVAQGSLVAYGATYQGQPSYVFKTLSGSFTCQKATFGIDPAPNVAKSCYSSGQSWVNRGPSGFTFCAVGDASATCQFNGVGQVAYGIDGQFVIKPVVQSGIACNVSIFGKDPASGYYKACYYRLY